MSNRRGPHNSEFSSVLNSPVSHLLKTNRAPSDEERKTILDFVEAAKKRVDEIQEHLEKASALEGLTWFDDLRASCEIEDIIHAHEALLSPIHSLPNEVLVLIFLACLPDITAALSAPSKWHTISSFQLSQVCRKWRNLAIRTPDMWVFLSNIFLDSTFTKKRIKSYKDFVKMLLDRSRDRDLQIFISATRDINYSWMEHPVLALLLEHERRWSALGLRCDRGGQPGSAIFSLPLSSLRRLHVDLRANDNYTGSAVNVTQFRRLEEITIVHEHNRFQVHLSSNQLRLYREVYAGHYERWDIPSSDIKKLGMGLEEFEVSMESMASFLSLDQAGTSEVVAGGRKNAVTLKNLKTLALWIGSSFHILLPPVIDGVVLPHLKVLKLAGCRTCLDDPDPDSPFVITALFISCLLPPDSLLRLYLRRVVFSGGDLWRILALTSNLEELIMDLPSEEDLEQLVNGLSGVPGTPEMEPPKVSLLPKLKGLAFEVGRHDVSQYSFLATYKRDLLLLGPALVVGRTHHSESTQEKRLTMPYFRLIFRDIYGARNALIAFNMENYDAADQSLGPWELDLAANKALRSRLEDLRFELRSTIYDLIERTRREESKSDLAAKLNSLFAEMEALELGQGRSIANLYATSLHVTVRYLLQTKQKVRPQNNKYMFRQRARRLLRRWDEVILADLKVRKLEWAIQGQRSLVYLAKSDDWHSLPQIKDAVYDGIPDDLARFDDFIWHESPAPQDACGNFEFY